MLSCSWTVQDEPKPQHHVRKPPNDLLIFYFDLAHLCPWAARALRKWQWALRAFARCDFSGNGQAGQRIFTGRAGKTGHGHAR